MVRRLLPVEASHRAASVGIAAIGVLTGALLLAGQTSQTPAPPSPTPAAQPGPGQPGQAPIGGRGTAPLEAGRVYGPDGVWWGSTTRR